MTPRCLRCFWRNTCWRISCRSYSSAELSSPEVALQPRTLRTTVQRSLKRLSNIVPNIFPLAETSPSPSPSSLSTTEKIAKKVSPRVAAAAEVFSITAARHVCKQILQLLHILFENISQDTSLYFLLSNNFINQIIECPFDFTDDEVRIDHFSQVHQGPYIIPLSSCQFRLYAVDSGALRFPPQDSLKQAKFPHHTFLLSGGNVKEDDDPSDTVPVFPLFSRALSLFRFPETMVSHLILFRSLLHLSNKLL